MMPRRASACAGGEVHPNAQFSQSRIIQRFEVERSVAPRDEHVARSIVRTCGERHLHARRNTRYHVAASGPQRIAHESTTLCPPCVLHRCAEFLCKQLDDGVLESRPRFVGKRQVVRVGTDAKNARSFAGHVHPALQRIPSVLRALRFITAAEQQCGQRHGSQHLGVEHRTQATPPTIHGSAKTYSVPPCGVWFLRSGTAIGNPNPMEGSSSGRTPNAATPAHPPTPERTATYCLPSEPR